MSHFAKLNENNIVTAVHCLSNKELLVDGIENEQKGVDFLNKIHNTSDTWKQTSYNTRAGTHILGGTPFRKNYAGVDFTYDENRDAFIPPKPFNSWILNETTCLWETPVAMPNDGNYIWNEDTLSWDIDPNTPNPLIQSLNNFVIPLYYFLYSIKV